MPEATRDRAVRNMIAALEAMGPDVTVEPTPDFAEVTGRVMTTYSEDFGPEVERLSNDVPDPETDHHDDPENGAA